MLLLSFLLLLFGARGDLLASHGEKALVLLFIRSDCPISNRYAPELQRLYQKYSSQHIRFQLVYPEAGLSEVDMERHAREYGYTIPAMLDPHHEYVALARATGTPETSVFVGDRLVYVGRIDDWYSDIGKAKLHAEHHDLDDVLAAVVAGKTVPPHQTQAVGCAIENLQ